MPKAYYNEIEPFAAQWLRNLIAANVIAPGDVDERSIVDVRPADIAGYTQCHFFAGIGVWSYALRLAGWPDDRPIWTGSCPCQPFSAAGRGAGIADARHLWPAWFRLIGECRPDVLIGEQVSGKDGKAWFDHVALDLEGIGYACAALSAGANGVGAPHQRRRLYWCSVADSERDGRWTDESGRRAQGRVAHGRHCPTDGLADAESMQCRSGEHNGQRDCEDMGPFPESRNGSHAMFPVASTDGAIGADGMGDGGTGLEGLAGHGDDRHRSRWDGAQPTRSTAEAGALDELGHSAISGSWPQHRQSRPDARQEKSIGGSGIPGALNGFWRNAVWLPCRDGKARPIEPGLEPLVDGAPQRVGRLRAYGNCICAPQAQAFIECVMECCP